MRRGQVGGGLWIVRAVDCESRARRYIAKNTTFFKLGFVLISRMLTYYDKPLHSYLKFQAGTEEIYSFESLMQVQTS